MPKGELWKGYKIVDEFWHSDLASDPDNQNKAQVPVFAGFDERGRRLWGTADEKGTNRKLSTSPHEVDL